jgi:hypothetical protein
MSNSTDRQPVSKNIALKDIVIDEGIQPRDGIKPQVVKRYVEAIENGAKMPPIVVFVVFDTGVTRYLAGGYHRYEAYRELGKRSVACLVYQGTREDAELFAIGDNNHGEHYTNEEKNKNVAKVLKSPLSANWSDRKIALHVGVSHEFVRNVRAAQVSTVDTSTERIGADGKTYNTANIGKKASAEGETSTVEFNPGDEVSGVDNTGQPVLGTFVKSYPPLGNRARCLVQDSTGQHIAFMDSLKHVGAENEAESTVRFQRGDYVKWADEKDGFFYYGRFLGTDGMRPGVAIVGELDTDLDVPIDDETVFSAVPWDHLQPYDPTEEDDDGDEITATPEEMERARAGIRAAMALRNGEAPPEETGSSDEPHLTVAQRIEAIPLYQALHQHGHVGRIFFDQAEIWFECEKIFKAAHAKLPRIRYTTGPISDSIQSLGSIPSPEHWEGCAACKGTLRVGERADPCPRCKGGFTVHRNQGVSADVVAAAATVAGDDE